MVQPQFKGQTYGEATAQERRVRAVPTGAAPTQQRAQQQAQQAPLTPLTAPTGRPMEPITAGAPFGEGPGPEALPFPVAPAIGDRVDLAMRVRAIAAQFPNAALLGLLAELEA